ncbi:hypothetical protein FQA39_LY03785 [Lamprigera yunnana]|nr:hypothetical protein FQA39_LY03785 [Lamprigera yunnana]
MGMNLGFITILIPQLLDDVNEVVKVKNEDITWIGSIASITSCIGSAGSGVISRVLGRKRTMLILTIPLIIFWIIHYFANKVWHILFALGGNGLCVGLFGAAAFAYVVEITEPQNRGTLAATDAFSLSSGVIFELLIGASLSWRTCAIISSVIPVISFCSLWFLPESPYWLISNNEVEKASESLIWYRGWADTESVENEFQSIYTDYQRNDKILKKAQKLTIQLIKEKFNFYVKSFIIPFVLVNFLFVLSNFYGGLTAQTYSVLIFSTLNVPINKYVANLLLGVMGLLGCGFSIVFVKYLGKRKSALASLLGVILCDIFIGLYAITHDVKVLQLHDAQNLSTDNVNEDRWIPLILFLTLMFIGSCGVSGLPWLLVGEVFPYETRDLGCALSIAMTYSISFLANKLYLDMISSLTFYGVYWFYAGFSFMGFIVVLLAIPETEGLTLQEISDHFTGRSKLKVTGTEHSDSVVGI